MTDTNFTPGPWKLASGSPEYICTDRLWVASTMGVTGTDEARANARLIAASPALYAALEGLKDILDRAESNASGNMEWDHVSTRVNAARAALKLARGDA